jgi:hypothetical protein
MSTCELVFCPPPGGKFATQRVAIHPRLYGNMQLEIAACRSGFQSVLDGVLQGYLRSYSRTRRVERDYKKEIVMVPTQLVV